MEEDKTKHATILTIGGLLALDRRKLAELLAVTENEIRVAVKRHEFSDELVSILNGGAHLVVDVLEHLRTLTHQHFRI